MALLAQLDQIEQLHGPVADLQRLVHVERVHDHNWSLQLLHGQQETPLAGCGYGASERGSSRRARARRVITAA